MQRFTECSQCFSRWTEAPSAATVNWQHVAVQKHTQLWIKLRQTWYCCDRKSLSGMRAKLRTVAASNNRVHMPWSLYYCLFTPHICGVVLRIHPNCGESHIQHNATGEVATVPGFEKSMKMCEELHENLSKCFQDLNGQETQMNLFQKPFGVNVENVNGADF